MMVPDSSGNRSNVAGLEGGALEVHVPNYPAVIHAVDAHVDHDGPRLEHIPGDDSGTADGGNHDVCA